VVENTLSGVALVRGMAEELKNKLCLCNKTHPHCTNLNNSDYLSNAVSDFVFHSSIMILLIFAI
jgi:hypothetical protein